MGGPIFRNFLPRCPHKRPLWALTRVLANHSFSFPAISGSLKSGQSSPKRGKLPMVSAPPDVSVESSRIEPAKAWVWAAFGVAVLALVGSLALSLGLGLRACPLCFYQRTFVMGVMAVLGMGLLMGAESSRL